MRRLPEIIDQVSGYHPNADLDLIERAYVFSAKVHQGQVRLSGEPYLSHPLEVAGLLADMRLDVPSIVAGILHDTIEDTVATKEGLEKMFGSEIVTIVEGVTKISQISFSSRAERQAENMRKMILAMATDIRVLVVKLADRLHNMRTLGFLPDRKQRGIARETLEIYAPLASRLGIQTIKSELEDLAFYYLEPKIYDEILSDSKLTRGLMRNDPRALAEWSRKMSRAADEDITPETTEIMDRLDAGEDVSSFIEEIKPPELRGDVEEE